MQIQSYVRLYMSILVNLTFTVWQFDPLKTAFEKYLWGWKFFKSIYLHLCVDKEHLGFSLATWKLCTFISPYLFYVRLCALLLLLFIFLHLNVDGNQLGSKKSTCVCVDVAQTWKKYLKLGGESTLSLPSNFPPRSDRPMVREIAKNQQATSQTLQV